MDLELRIMDLSLAPPEQLKKTHQDILFHCHEKLRLGMSAALDLRDASQEGVVSEEYAHSELY